MFPFLTALILLPAVGALALMVLPRTWRARSRHFALAFAVAEFVLAAVMVSQFDATRAGTHQFAEVYPWIPQIGTSWALGIDGIALLMIVLAVTLTPLAMLAAWKEDADPSRQMRYFALILVLQAFMVGIFAARDVFLFYVLFEAMLVPLYFLIGTFGGARRRQAAVSFLLYGLAGGLIMLVAVIALYFYGGGGPEAFLTANLVGLDIPVVPERLMFIGFFIAFAIKAPMVPLHTWLPDVAEQARPGTTALLVAVLDKVGTFGMLTLAIALFPNAAAWAAPVIIPLAVVSVIYGALAAIGQTHMMRLVAFTSVSHFGIMVLGIFVFTQTAVEGAAFYMFNHGLSTGALFLLVGFLVSRRGSALISDFGGLQKVTPVFAGLFLIVGLSALALPGLSPFVSEIMVLVGGFEVARVAVIVATAGVVLAAVYVLWAYQRVFHGATNPELDGTPDLSLRERLVVAPLIGVMLVLGFVPASAIDLVREPAATVVSYVAERER